MKRLALILFAVVLWADDHIGSLSVVVANPNNIPLMVFLP